MKTRLFKIDIETILADCFGKYAPSLPYDSKMDKAINESVREAIKQAVHNTLAIEFPDAYGYTPKVREEREQSILNELLP